MEVPAPLLNGSITYLVLTLLACCAGVGMGITGKLSRENASYVRPWRWFLSLFLARSKKRLAGRRSGLTRVDCCVGCARQDIYAALVHGRRVPVDVLVRRWAADRRAVYMGSLSLTPPTTRARVLPAGRAAGSISGTYWSSPSTEASELETRSRRSRRRDSRPGAASDPRGSRWRRAY